MGEIIQSTYKLNKCERDLQRLSHMADIKTLHYIVENYYYKYTYEYIIQIKNN